MKPTLILIAMLSTSSLFFANLLAGREIQAGIDKSQETATKPSPQSAALRFDGIYQAQGIGTKVYWRFFPDGTVAYHWGNDNVQYAANATRGGFKDRYKIQGLQLVIEKHGGESYKGTVEENGLRMRRLLHDGPYPGAPLEYLFQFIRDEPNKPSASSVSSTVPGEVPSPPSADVVLGQADLDQSCQKLEFKPSTEPVKFATGTSEVAYQISLNYGTHPSAMPETRVEDNLKCSTVGIESRQCNRYAIIMGNPAVVQSTVIVSCKDKKPFKPGTYELELLMGGKRTKAISFVIEGSAPVKPTRRTGRIRK
jgi:hypothetical protein